MLGRKTFFRLVMGTLMIEQIRGVMLNHDLSEGAVIE